MTQYSTISLPIEIYNVLQELIEKKPELGYSSVADFCKEAIRIHVQEIKRELREDFLRRMDVPTLLKKVESLSAVECGTYGEAFEKVRDMIFFASKDFIIKECNSEFVSHLGYTRKEDLIGCDIGRIFGEEIKERMKKGELKDYETVAVRRDGKKIDVLLSTGRLKGKVAYVGIAKDITVRRYVEEKERRARELYEYLINEICDTVVVVQDGKVKFVNKSVTESGYKNSDLIGKSFIEIVAPEDRKRIMEKYKGMIEGKEKSEPRRYKLIRKDGKIAEAEMLSRKIEYEGRPALLVTVRFLERR